MSDDNKQLALAEKDLGNQAYKKREFETALGHYDKAYALDDTNITFLTNKAGKYDINSCQLCLLLTSVVCF